MRAPYIVAVGGTSARQFNDRRGHAIRAGRGRARRRQYQTHQRVRLCSCRCIEPDNRGAQRRGPGLGGGARAGRWDHLGSPGYHGSISGLVKNALDYAEDLRTDARPYFSGRAVGCIATAGGWSAAVNTLGALRDIVHALRGWPTPLGAAINSAEMVFDEDGICRVPRVAQVLELIAREVIGFARPIR